MCVCVCARMHVCMYKREKEGGKERSREVGGDIL